MGTTFCMTWLIIAGGAAAAEPARPHAYEPAAPEEARGRKVQAVIDEVEKACRDRTICMIGRKKAERLAELVREAKPKLVVECGTAIGYSGLWIARELKKSGRGKLVTIEISPQRAKEAEASFRKAGLQQHVTVKVGDARKVVDQIDGPIDFLFVDCGYSNYHPILVKLEEKLRKGAVVVADNVGIGARGMDDYLKLARSKYQSRTEWFDVDLPWAKRDAMEVTVISGERQPFLGWPEEKQRTIGHDHPESALAALTKMTAVRPSTYDQYLARKNEGEITVEAFRDGYVYYAIETDRDVPFAATDGGPISAWIMVTERFKAKIPAGEPR